MTFNLEIMLQEHNFQPNMNTLLAAVKSFLNSFQDGNEHTNVMTKKSKKKAFKTNREKNKCKTSNSVWIQVTFILETKLQNDSFWAGNANFLKPCQDVNVHKNATTKELKKKAFIVKSQSIKQAIGIQLTVMLEIELQKQVS